MNVSHYRREKLGPLPLAPHLMGQSSKRRKERATVKFCLRNCNPL